MKTLKQLGYTLVELQEFTFDDKYDNSVFVPLEVIREWLTQKRISLQEPEYNPQTYQGSYAMLGKEQMIDELLEDLAK